MTRDQVTTRELWREYYRAVRILAAIRTVDRFAFLRFSRAWWDDRLDAAYKASPTTDELRSRLRALRPRRLP